MEQEDDRMHMPIEEQRLLWAAIVWVSLKYHGEKPAAKAKRPQLVYQNGDGKVIGPLIREIRRQYEVDRLDRVKPNLQTIKARTLQLKMAEGLTLEKRNFYSSVISTFFSWTYHGTPESRRGIINLIASLPPPPSSLKATRD